MRLSHSTRVRGLKYRLYVLRSRVTVSHSTRVRGLKSIPQPKTSFCQNVALYTSAWIEISTSPAGF